MASQELSPDMKRGRMVAIVGATGAVGEVLLRMLEQRAVPDRASCARWRASARPARR